MIRGQLASSPDPCPELRRGQDAVKGSRHFLRVGQRSSGVLGPMSSTAGNQEAWSSICACAVNRRSTGQGQKTGHGQTVKPEGHSRTIKNLTAVAALDTVPMGVTPLLYRNLTQLTNDGTCLPPIRHCLTERSHQLSIQ